MYSECKLNKQGDNIQPWSTPFPIWNQSVVPCPVLTVASSHAYRFLKVGQVIWYSHLFQTFPQFIVIHTVKVFGIVSKAEIDVFLELSCFFDDPADVGNLISGSSAFSKSSLNTWKFMVELSDVQAGFRKGKDQTANIRWIIKKAREYQKNIYFCFIDYAKAFDCVDHNQLWKILKQMGIRDHLTCLLRNLYAGQEETIRLDMEKQTGSK